MFGKQQILPTVLEEEMESSYLDYSMSVIVSRALPDARDGLKPVHRRILYAMQDLGLVPNKPHKKSARLVGETLGKYHPHGDQSVYDALVRMAQYWSMRYPFVDGQGNFGSLDGDSPAAMRYTEARLAQIAVETLRDINKNTVDFRDNFDESLKEPVVLPSATPTLLLNGASGIAVGMATNIPPHNLREVVSGIKAVIANPEIPTEELIKHIPAPDFPTGGVIYGYEGVKEAYETGRGKIILRAKAAIEEHKSGKKSIIVTELPYQVVKANMIEKMAEMVKNKTLEDISDLRDESDRDGVRIVIDLKRDANPSVALNNLYKKTQLQVTFGANMLALSNGSPKVLTLKDMISEFVAHRNEVIVRRTQFDLDAAKKRAHILEGFLIALDNLDEVITMIRESPDAPAASEKLQKRFELTEVQAKAILDMRLHRLTGLEREKILNEYKELIKEIERLSSILASKELQLGLIVEELEELDKKYGDERRTEIVADSREFTVEDMIANEDVIVTITRKGFIKRTPVSNYRRQHKGGRGAYGAGTHDEDFVDMVFQASTHHNLLFFTDLGRGYCIKVYDLPEGSRNSKGRSLANVIQKTSDENVTAYLPVKEFSDDEFVFMATKNGVVKKTSLSQFSHVRSGGIIAIGLQNEDRLISARLSDGACDVILGTSNGIACRFRESDVRSMGRSASGVRGISLESDDKVVSMAVVKRPDSQIVVVGEKGYGKRTKYEEFRLTKRGAKGVISMNVTPRTGKVVALKLVVDSEDLVVMTTKGILIRQPVKDIRTIGRNTQGVRLIRLGADDKIADITAVSREETLDDEESEAPDHEGLQEELPLDD